MSDEASADQTADDEGADPVPQFNLMKPREWHRYTRYHFLLAKFLFLGGIAWLILWSLSYIGDVLFPVFLSLLIAYLFDPFIDWFEERGIRRTIGIGTVLFVALLVVGVLVGFLYPTIVEQVRTLIDRVPQLIELIQTKTIPWVEKTFDYKLPATVSEGLQKYGESLGEYLPGMANRVGTWAQGLVTGTGAFLVGLLNTVMIPIFTFYFLRDFDRIQNQLRDFIPEHRRDVVIDRLRKMDEVIGEWVRGQIQVASILAILYAIGLSIAFSMADIPIRSGIAIGILAGLLNFIPYFGVAVGIVLATLMVLINWSGFPPLIAVAAVFFSVQMLEGYLITPKIVGEKVGLSPVTVIIVLLIGGELYGLLGILLAIPLFGALKVLFPDIMDYYRKTPFYSGRRFLPGGVEAPSAAEAPTEPKREEAVPAANGSVAEHGGGVRPESSEDGAGQTEVDEEGDEPDGDEEDGEEESN